MKATILAMLTSYERNFIQSRNGRIKSQKAGPFIFSAGGPCYCLSAEDAGYTTLHLPCTVLVLRPLPTDAMSQHPCVGNGPSFHVFLPRSLCTRTIVFSNGWNHTALYSTLEAGCHGDQKVFASIQFFPPDRLQFKPSK